MFAVCVSVCILIILLNYNNKHVYPDIMSWAGLRLFCQKL